MVLAERAALGLELTVFRVPLLSLFVSLSAVSLFTSCRRSPCCASGNLVCERGEAQGSGYTGARARRRRRVIEVSPSQERVSRESESKRDGGGEVGGAQASPLQCALCPRAAGASTLFSFFFSLESVKQLKCGAAARTACGRALKRNHFIAVVASSSPYYPKSAQLNINIPPPPILFRVPHCGGVQGKSW